MTEIDALATSDAERAAAHHANAWPFVEARRVLERYKDTAPAKGYVLFETGYGPSGLPHIGTFGEVVRTTMVRHAFALLSDLPTRLFAFSDDMDGLRKVPDNVPNQEMVAQHLGKPLTRIPDPFGTHESFGAHNNARLRGVPRSVRLRLRVHELRPSATHRAGSTTRCCRCCERYDEITARHPADAGPGAARHLQPVPAGLAADRPRAAGADRPARDADAGTIVYRGRGRHAASRCRSPAAAASCNGRSTGRCAGRRSASITRCRART